MKHPPSSTNEGGKPPKRVRLTREEKLREIEKAWGYAEVTRVLYLATGERRYCVRNYSGSIIDQMWALRGLPGNPTATKKIEITGPTEEEAVTTAYWRMLWQMKNKGGGKGKRQRK